MGVLTGIIYRNISHRTLPIEASRKYSTSCPCMPYMVQLTAIRGLYITNNIHESASGLIWMNDA